MAINKNHEFDDLNGIRCAIVEKNVNRERVTFLKELLEYNRYTVLIVPSPPPKVAAVVAHKEGEPDPLPLPTPETFTVGVTDVSFNVVNAIFGRLLHSKDGHIVSWSYWLQQEQISDDETPYFDKKV